MAVCASADPGAARDGRAAATAGGAAHRRGNQGACRPARLGKIQGHDQGSDAVRRSPPGHGPQSRRDRLDRGAAQELRLPDRTHQVRIQPAAADRGRPRRTRRRPRQQRPCARAAAGRGAFGRAPASTSIRSCSPIEKLRELNMQPTTPGPREEVFCTKVGTTHPEEMYIVGAHMDGHGWGEAANDDGSGTALVMELARIFSAADVQTERTIRFALWNNEETGLNGARAYVAQREAAAGQGRPAGLGQVSRTEMARHDPARHDDVRPRHAAPRRHD